MHAVLPSNSIGERAAGTVAIGDEWLGIPASRTLCLGLEPIGICLPILPVAGFVDLVRASRNVLLVDLAFEDAYVAMTVPTGIR